MIAGPMRFQTPVVREFASSLGQTSNSSVLNFNTNSFRRKNQFHHPSNQEVTWTASLEEKAVIENIIFDFKLDIKNLIYNAETDPAVIKIFTEAFPELQLNPMKPDTERFIKYKLPLKESPFILNWTMLEKADVLLALWDGQSKLTLDAVSRAVKMIRPVILYNIKSGEQRYFHIDKVNKTFRLPDEECRSCAACCRFYAEKGRSIEVMNSDPNYTELVPFCQPLTEDSLGFFRKMLISEIDDSPACAALQKDEFAVEQQYSCALYRIRPFSCSSFSIGNPNCLKSRRAKGMAAFETFEPNEVFANDL